MIKVSKSESEVLSLKETYVLINLAQKGNNLARQRLLSHNFRFVAAVVGSIVKNINCPIFDDLIQEGIIGLNKAIMRFDTKTKMKFSTYAIWWIRHSVGYYYRCNLGVIRVPDNVGYFITNQIKKNNSKIREVQCIGGDYMLKVEGLPQSASISKGLNLKRVSEESREGNSIFDAIASADPNPEEVLMQNEPKIDMTCLNEREKSIILDKFYAEKGTYRDLAQDYGVSHVRIRQVAKNAIKKLRENNKKFSPI